MIEGTELIQEISEYGGGISYGGIHVSVQLSYAELKTLYRTTCKADALTKWDGMQYLENLGGWGKIVHALYLPILYFTSLLRF